MLANPVRQRPQVARHKCQPYFQDIYGGTYNKHFRTPSKTGKMRQEHRINLTRNDWGDTTAKGDGSTVTTSRLRSSPGLRCSARGTGTFRSTRLVAHSAQEEPKTGCPPTKPSPPSGKPTPAYTLCNPTSPRPCYVATPWPYNSAEPCPHCASAST